MAPVENGRQGVEHPFCCGELVTVLQPNQLFKEHDIRIIAESRMSCIRVQTWVHTSVSSVDKSAHSSYGKGSINCLDCVKLGSVRHFPDIISFTVKLLNITK